jgi:hypothetical protein
MEDPESMLLRMLPIFLWIVLGGLSRQSPTRTRTPAPARPFQLPPRRRIRRNRVEFRSSGVQHAVPPTASSSHPMWDRWLDT